MSINTHADKTPENKGQSVADTVSSERGIEETSLQFIDNRPAAIAQRKLNDLAISIATMIYEGF